MKNRKHLTNFIVLFLCVNIFAFMEKGERTSLFESLYAHESGISAESIVGQNRTAIAVFQQEKKARNTTVYDTFLNEYNCNGKPHYYSYAELTGFDYPILLISEGAYRINDMGKVTTIADIYYPVNQEIKFFGSIRSVGTAYPLAANATGIFTAGGHEVKKYTLDRKNQSLKLISSYMTIYTGLETGVKSVTIAILGDEERVVTENDFTIDYREYGDADLLYFMQLDCKKKK